MIKYIKQISALAVVCIGLGVHSPAYAQDDGKKTTIEENATKTASPSNADGAKQPATTTPDGTTPEGTTTDGTQPKTTTATGLTPEGEAKSTQGKDTKSPKTANAASGGEEKPEHENHFTIEKMWEASGIPVKIVLLLLLFMLLACGAVAIERWFMFKAAQKQSNILGTLVGRHLTQGDIQSAITESSSSKYPKSYLARLVQAGLTEFQENPNKEGIEAIERAIEKNAIGENESLRKNLTILATTGATAPFVGLVGTIFGIINAFQQMGQDGGSDLTTLAPAIGEALITTAFGIIVALVGVWLFNYFTSKIEKITNDMNMHAQDLINWCYKQTIKKTQQAAK